MPRGLSSVHGELRFAGGAETVPELGPVVVFLEREPDVARWPRLLARTLPDDARDGLGHELVVVARGASVRFASRSGLEHRLFAVREHERIEVAVPAEDDSVRVRMLEPGLARFYCSLHHEETWDVYVAPSPLFDRVDAERTFRIVGVPPGEYTLHIWSPSVEGRVGNVSVGVQTSAPQTIWLDPTRVDP